MEAVIVVDPATTAVAIPVVAIVATVVLVELQVTVAVRSAVELSEYVPVAVNCWVAPTVLLGLAGVTAMDESVGVVVGVAVAVPVLVFVAGAGAEYGLQTILIGFTAGAGTITAVVLPCQMTVSTEL
jgi:hypothetical protein